jgi:lipopolysaccharide transport system ATP-binding protein
MSSERERRSEDVVIRIRNAGKCYHMYDAPVDRLKQALFRWRRTYFREFWAVRGVDLEVHRGEAVGIVGRNGSGKSTLLQMIAGTLAPSEGTAEVAGRIAALLELGSGFNPEFTGRENVFMNAAILGLSRREIEDRFDAIASFADIGPFLDQPVKTYSSGMLVRLAFAVQVQVEPDVLIVDEALAVGDSLFQKRCFQRLEALRSQGVTLLFVSHDQESVRTLTSRAILLHQGRVRALGTSSEVILEYRRLLHEAELAWGASQVLPTPAQPTSTSTPPSSSTPPPPTASASEPARSDALSFGTLDASVQSVRLLDAKGEAASAFKPGDEVRVRIACEIHRPLEHLNIGLRIRNKQGVKMYSWGTLNQDISIWSGRAAGEPFWDRSFKAGERVEVEFAFVCALGMNFYEVQASVSQERDRYYRDQRMLHWIDEAAFFQVIIHQDDYFFGGVCDLAMTARVLTDSPVPSNS